MSGPQRIAAVALWGLVVLVVGALVGGGATAGEVTHRAGLVVVDEDGAMQRVCVEFTGDEISGAELLRRSGLAVVFSASGAFGEGVCSLDGTGCNDPGDCFCQCRGANCAYWAYFRLDGGGWRFQAVGPSQRRLSNGDVDGWIWGGGRVPPDPVAFADVCPLANAAPTAVPTAASQPPRPAPRPTATRSQAPVPTAVAAVLTATPVSSEPPAAGPTPARRTAPATPDEDRAVARPDDATDVPVAGDPALDVDSDGGAPVGLIAFGAVAGGLVVVAGGITLRRRLRD